MSFTFPAVPQSVDPVIAPPNGAPGRPSVRKAPAFNTDAALHVPIGKGGGGGTPGPGTAPFYPGSGRGHIGLSNTIPPSSTWWGDKNATTSLVIPPAGGTVKAGGPVKKRRK